MIGKFCFIKYSGERVQNFRFIVKSGMKEWSQTWNGWLLFFQF